MSSDAESISSGMHLPGWMRSRVEKSDFDGIPFSPPSHDESFFYIRYPVNPSDNDTTSSGIKQITDILHGGRRTGRDESNHFRNIDFSKHTESCKKFLKDSPNTPAESIKNPPKSFGTDDGFKGPGAACGSSIVKVAQQMVSSRSLTSRGFKVATFDQQNQKQEQPLPDPDNAFQTKTIEDQQVQASKLIQPQSSLLIDEGDRATQQMIQQSNRFMYRRGSKSLPSSPLSSPKSMRKYQPNPYFTGTFSFVNSNNPEGGRSWFLSSLLGIQREATSTSSISHIEEETEDILPQKNQSNNINNSSKADNQTVLKAKPSELREMNFWSPTSM